MCMLCRTFADKRLPNFHHLAGQEFLLLKLQYFSFFIEISHQWKRDHDFDNYIDTAHEVFYDDDTSLVECAALCGRITHCLSFFYHLLDRHCHGVSLEFGSSTGFTYLPNMGYYKGKTVYTRASIQSRATIGQQRNANRIAFHWPFRRDSLEETL